MKLINNITFEQTIKVARQIEENSNAYSKALSKFYSSNINSVSTQPENHSTFIAINQNIGLNQLQQNVFPNEKVRRKSDDEVYNKDKEKKIKKNLLEISFVVLEEESSD
ncbi:10621_t:CDS:2 [Cetraspora pellucida]|uniref:10621_t:CDS:1 n=1 Tax=Cetraspora pellucida TaxID=1433469 RepID=A0A9N9AYP0_9GLOM|nr:10621_t:CDS:2 [Cetraspora pellucida]